VRRRTPLILNLVDGEDWLTSCPTHSTPRKKPGTFCRGSWADHKADMDILEKRKISFLPSRIQTTDHPAHRTVALITINHPPRH